MKKILLSLSILMFITGLYGARPVGAGSPPAIDVSVVLLDSDNKATDTFLLDEPITVVISMENVGPDTVIAQEAFLSRQYHLELHFTYTRADGTKELVTADVPYNIDEPKPPRVKLIEGQLRQVEGVVFLESGWAWSVNPFDALDHYRIDLTGFWSVKALIANRTYLPSALVIYSGKTYGKIPLAYWGGDHESSPVNFKIIGDWDNDGHFYPEVPPGPYPPEVDCNDYDASVNPGTPEIANNGIDDDCNPATPDRVTADMGTCEVFATKYIINGDSVTPAFDPIPISGMMVKAFELTEGSCASTYGDDRSQYETIWKNCSTPYARMTDGAGQRSLTLPPGVYILIAKYDPDLHEAPGSDTDDPTNDIVVGVGVDDLESNQTLHKYLTIIGTSGGELTPGICHVVKGSELLIIQPQYLVWAGNPENCPFVFESKEGDWTVATELDPPKGFNAVSIPDQPLNTGQLIAVQPAITRTKPRAKLNPIKVKYTVMHEGWKKAKKVESKIDMISN